MKILTKIIVCILVITSIICINQNYSVAAKSDLSGSSIFSKGKAFISKGGSGKISQSTAENDLKPIGNILFGIAIMVLIVVGLIMGVKYAMQGADERANMKQKLIWYIVAAVLVFSAAGVYNVVYDVVTKATN